jgi:hypothetical protein
MSVVGHAWNGMAYKGRVQCTTRANQRQQRQRENQRGRPLPPLCVSGGGWTDEKVGGGMKEKGKKNIGSTLFPGFICPSTHARVRIMAIVAIVQSLRFSNPPRKSFSSSSPRRSISSTLVSNS